MSTGLETGWIGEEPGQRKVRLAKLGLVNP